MSSKPNLPEKQKKLATPTQNRRAPKPEKKKTEGSSMTVMGHLREIRTRLVRVALVYVVLVVLCFLFIDSVSEALLRLGSGFNFVYTAPAELVTSYVKLTLVCALVLASPFVLYQIWGFVAPALTVREKRLGFLGLLGGLVFFLLGAVFAYFVAIPFMLEFFVNFNNSELITPMISYDNYLNFVLVTAVSFGVVFEMPVLSLLLSQFGILKPQFLRKFRKYALLIMAIVAAIITPPDVVSQVAILVPMMLLYELSVLISSAVVRRKASKNADSDDNEEDKDSPSD